jgi:hypothetical protein
MIPHSTTVSAYDADHNIVYRFVVAPDDMSYSSMSTCDQPAKVDARTLTMRILKETHRMRQKIRQIRGRRNARSDLSQWHGTHPGWQYSRTNPFQSAIENQFFLDNTLFPKTWTCSVGKPSLSPWGSRMGAFPHEEEEPLSVVEIEIRKDFKGKQLERRRMGSLRAAF